MLTPETAQYYLQFAETGYGDTPEAWIIPPAYSELRNKILDVFADFLSTHPHLGIKVFLDGVAAAGKGKLTEFLQQFGFETISFGSMARGLTKFALEQGYLPQHGEERSPEKVDAFLKKLDTLQISIEKDQVGSWIVIHEFASGKSVELARYNVRTDLGDVSVTQNISFVAGLEKVCTILDDSLIQMTAEIQHIVLDGRDNIARRIPTEEEFAYKLRFSDLRFFTFYTYVYAEQSLRVARAKQRRLEELQAKGITMSEIGLADELEAVGSSIIARDVGDINRSMGALMDPDQARASSQYDWFFDTSKYSIEQMRIVFLARLLTQMAPNVGLALQNQLIDYFELLDKLNTDESMPQPTLTGVPMTSENIFSEHAVLAF